GPPTQGRKVSSAVPPGLTRAGRGPPHPAGSEGPSQALAPASTLPGSLWSKSAPVIDFVIAPSGPGPDSIPPRPILGRSSTVGNYTMPCQLLKAPRRLLGLDGHPAGRPFRLPALHLDAALAHQAERRGQGGELGQDEGRRHPGGHGELQDHPTLPANPDPGDHPFPDKLLHLLPRGPAARLPAPGPPFLPLALLVPDQGLHHVAARFVQEGLGLRVAQARPPAEDVNPIQLVHDWPPSREPPPSSPETPGS